jgi:hypothetical protein
MGNRGNEGSDGKASVRRFRGSVERPLAHAPAAPPSAPSVAPMSLAARLACRVGLPAAVLRHLR